MQRRIQELLGDTENAIDGCGLPTYAMSLTAAAGLLERVPPRIAEAMRARPELIGGPGGADTDLMRARPGWLAKSGAEGLLCAVSPDGRGLALKVEDGATRAVAPALGAFLGIDELAVTELRNSLGERRRRGRRHRLAAPSEVDGMMDPKSSILDPKMLCLAHACRQCGTFGIRNWTKRTGDER